VAIHTQRREKAAAQERQVGKDKHTAKMERTANGRDSLTIKARRKLPTPKTPRHPVSDLNLGALSQGAQLM